MDPKSGVLRRQKQIPVPICKALQLKFEKDRRRLQKSITRQLIDDFYGGLYKEAFNYYATRVLQEQLYDTLSTLRTKVGVGRTPSPGARLFGLPSPGARNSQTPSPQPGLHGTVSTGPKTGLLGPSVGPESHPSLQSKVGAAHSSLPSLQAKAGVISPKPKLHGTASKLPRPLRAPAPQPLLHGTASTRPKTASPDPKISPGFYDTHSSCQGKAGTHGLSSRVNRSPSPGTTLHTTTTKETLYDTFPSSYTKAGVGERVSQNPGPHNTPPSSQTNVGVVSRVPRPLQTPSPIYDTHPSSRTKAAVGKRASRLPRPLRTPSPQLQIYETKVGARETASTRPKTAPPGPRYLRTPSPQPWLHETPLNDHSLNNTPQSSYTKVGLPSTGSRSIRTPSPQPWLHGTTSAGPEILRPALKGPPKSSRLHRTALNRPQTAIKGPEIFGARLRIEKLSAEEERQIENLILENLKQKNILVKGSHFEREKEGDINFERGRVSDRNVELVRSFERERVRREDFDEHFERTRNNFDRARQSRANFEGSRVRDATVERARNFERARQSLEEAKKDFERARENFWEARGRERTFEKARQNFEREKQDFGTENEAYNLSKGPSTKVDQKETQKYISKNFERARDFWEGQKRERECEVKNEMEILSKRESKEEILSVRENNGDRFLEKIVQTGTHSKNEILTEREPMSDKRTNVHCKSEILSEQELKIDTSTDPHIEINIRSERELQIETGHSDIHSKIDKKIPLKVTSSNEPTVSDIVKSPNDGILKEKVTCVNEPKNNDKKTPLSNPESPVYNVEFVRELHTSPMHIEQNPFKFKSNGDKSLDSFEKEELKFESEEKDSILKQKQHQAYIKDQQKLSQLESQQSHPHSISLESQHQSQPHKETPQQVSQLNSKIYQQQSELNSQSHQDKLNQNPETTQSHPDPELPPHLPYLYRDLPQPHLDSYSTVSDLENENIDLNDPRFDNLLELHETSSLEVELPSSSNNNSNSCSSSSQELSDHMCDSNLSDNNLNKMEKPSTSQHIPVTQHRDRKMSDNSQDSSDGNYHSSQELSQNIQQKQCDTNNSSISDNYQANTEENVEAQMSDLHSSPSRLVRARTFEILQGVPHDKTPHEPGHIHNTRAAASKHSRKERDNRQKQIEPLQVDTDFESEMYGVEDSHLSKEELERKQGSLIFEHNFQTFSNIPINNSMINCDTILAGTMNSTVMTASMPSMGISDSFRLNDINDMADNISLHSHRRQNSNDSNMGINISSSIPITTHRRQNSNESNIVSMSSSIPIGHRRQNSIPLSDSFMSEPTQNFTSKTGPTMMSQSLGSDSMMERASGFCETAQAPNMSLEMSNSMPVSSIRLNNFGFCGKALSKEELDDEVKERDEWSEGRNEEKNWRERRGNERDWRERRSSWEGRERGRRDSWDGREREERRRSERRESWEERERESRERRDSWEGRRSSREEGRERGWREHDRDGEKNWRERRDSREGREREWRERDRDMRGSREERERGWRETEREWRERERKRSEGREEGRESREGRRDSREEREKKWSKESRENEREWSEHRDGGKREKEWREGDRNLSEHRDGEKDWSEKNKIFKQTDRHTDIEPSWGPKMGGGGAEDTPIISVVGAVPQEKDKWGKKENKSSSRKNFDETPLVFGFVPSSEVEEKSEVEERHGGNGAKMGGTGAKGGKNEAKIFSLFMDGENFGEIGKEGEKITGIGEKATEIGEKTRESGERKGELGEMEVLSGGDGEKLEENVGKVGEKIAPKSIFSMFINVDKTGEKLGETGEKNVASGEKSGMKLGKGASIGEKIGPDGEKTGLIRETGCKTGDIIGEKPVTIGGNVDKFVDNVCETGEIREEIPPHVPKTEASKSEANKPASIFSMFINLKDLKSPEKEVEKKIEKPKAQNCVYMYIEAESSPKTRRRESLGSPKFRSESPFKVRERSESPFKVTPSDSPKIQRKSRSKGEIKNLTPSDSPKLYAKFQCSESQSSKLSEKTKHEIQTKNEMPCDSSKLPQKDGIENKTPTDSPKLQRKSEKIKTEKCKVSENTEKMKKTKIEKDDDEQQSEIEILEEKAAKEFESLLCGTAGKTESERERRKEKEKRRREESREERERRREERERRKEEGRERVRKERREREGVIQREGTFERKRKDSVEGREGERTLEERRENKEEKVRIREKGRKELEEHREVERERRKGERERETENEMSKSAPSQYFLNTDKGSGLSVMGESSLSTKMTQSVIEREEFISKPPTKKNVSLNENINLNSGLSQNSILSGDSSLNMQSSLTKSMDESSLNTDQSGLTKSIESALTKSIEESSLNIDQSGLTKSIESDNDISTHSDLDEIHSSLTKSMEESSLSKQNSSKQESVISKPHSKSSESPQESTISKQISSLTKQEIESSLTKSAEESILSGILKCNKESSLSKQESSKRESTKKSSLTKSEVSVKSKEKPESAVCKSGASVLSKQESSTSKQDSALCKSLESAKQISKSGEQSGISRSSSGILRSGIPRPVKSLRSVRSKEKCPVKDNQGKDGDMTSSYETVDMTSSVSLSESLISKGTENSDVSDVSSLLSSIDRSSDPGDKSKGDGSSSLGEDLLRMFENEINTDVTIQVGRKQIRAHKCILVSRCVYFAAILSGHWVAKAGNVIKIEGFSYECVMLALQHIYSGTTQIPDKLTKKVYELAALADLLGLDGLRDVIELHLKANLCHYFHKPCDVCIEGTFEALQIAGPHCLYELYNDSLKWVCKYFQEILPTANLTKVPVEIKDSVLKYIMDELTPNNVIETTLKCLDTLPSSAKAGLGETNFEAIQELLDGFTTYIGANLKDVVTSERFLSLGQSEYEEDVDKIFDTILASCSYLKPDQAVLSHIELTKILEEERDGVEKYTGSYLNFIDGILEQVEGFMVQNLNRVCVCRKWPLLSNTTQRRIKEANRRIRSSSTENVRDLLRGNPIMRSYSATITRTHARSHSTHTRAHTPSRDPYVRSRTHTPTHDQKRTYTPTHDQKRTYTPTHDQKRTHTPTHDPKRVHTPTHDQKRTLHTRTQSSPQTRTQIQDLQKRTQGQTNTEGFSERTRGQTHTEGSVKRTQTGDSQKRTQIEDSQKRTQTPTRSQTLPHTHKRTHTPPPTRQIRTHTPPPTRTHTLRVQARQSAVRKFESGIQRSSSASMVPERRRKDSRPPQVVPHDKTAMPPKPTRGGTFIRNSDKS